MSDFNTADFRSALGRFATGVTVVTAKAADGRAIGMTASSFNSVSLDPPLILWSVTKSSQSAADFAAAEFFCVNILGEAQTELSNHFATSQDDKFKGVDFEDGVHGSPKLAGAICHLECSRWAVYDGGDHEIIVGKVEGFDTQAGGGLLFADGRYGKLAAL